MNRAPGRPDAPWPTREEWAEHRRTFYGDEALDIVVSSTLSDYASPGEIADVIAALKARRLTYEVGSYRRDDCNRTLRLLKRGEVPVVNQGHCNDIVEPFRQRWRAAWEDAVAAAEAERAKTPIDDVAWAAELQRRLIEHQRLKTK